MFGTLTRTWERLRRWWKGKPPEVKPPEEVDLVPIPPPVFQIIFPEPVPELEPEPVIVTPLAVDSQLKRMSVLAVRYGRLPFGRRFTTPIPDGTLAAADRLIIGASYAGIAANEPGEEVVIARSIAWHQALLVPYPYP